MTVIPVTNDSVQILRTLAVIDGVTPAEVLDAALRVVWEVSYHRMKGYDMVLVPVPAEVCDDGI